MRTITEQMLEDFEKYLQNSEKSCATCEKYKRDVLHFKEWLGERKIEKATIIEYKQALITEYAPASTNSMLSSINALFSYENWTDCKVKTFKIERKIYIDEKKELTKEEYKKLLETAEKMNNRKLCLLMQTICSTGIRISELKYVTIEHIKKGEAIINCKGKVRVIMFPDTLCKMLETFAENAKITTGPVFVSRNGKPLDRSNVWRTIKNLCKVADVSEEKVFPHNFRHLFARTYYSAEKDIVRLADILGHASINTTRIYTMERGSTHKKQIQSLGLLMN